VAGLGGAQGGEEGESLLPVAAALIDAAGSAEDVAESAVGAGVLVLVAGRAGPGQRGGVLGPGPHPAGRLPGAVVAQRRLTEAGQRG
jgi:hypothetical protein